jgi:hypothetical protein
VYVVCVESCCVVYVRARASVCDMCASMCVYVRE